MIDIFDSDHVGHSGPLRVGIGGPVGSGKTALMDALCKYFRDAYDIAAITNDIYTKEDAEFLTRAGSLAPERILGVETGGFPHDRKSTRLNSSHYCTSLLPSSSLQHKRRVS